MTTSEEIKALAAWDTPALSNALDALRLRPFNAGYTDGSVRRITGGDVMAGRAVTARMVAREPGEDGIPVSRLHQVISELDGPVVVVIEDLDQPPGVGAFLGEVNGSLLAALGIAGLTLASARQASAFHLPRHLPRSAGRSGAPSPQPPSGRAQCYW